MEITPLQGWIARKIGIPRGENLDFGILHDHQLNLLQKTLALAKNNSPFYDRHLRSVHLQDLKSMADIIRLPFTFPQDVAESGLQMLCVSQSEIARVVTLQTSGSTGNPKRVYFTRKDLELTANFFAHGMKALVKPGLAEGLSARHSRDAMCGRRIFFWKSWINREERCRMANPEKSF